MVMAMMMIMVDVLWWIMDAHIEHGCCNKNVVDEEKEMRNMRMMMRKSEKQ